MLFSNWSNAISSSLLFFGPEVIPANASFRRNGHMTVIRPRIQSTCMKIFKKIVHVIE